MEQYYLLVLKYLSVQTEPANVNTMQIEGIPPDFIKTIVNELFDKQLVTTGLGGWVGINEKGKVYLIKHDLGIQETKPAIHIGHNIGGNVVQSDLSQDNSLYSPKIIVNKATHKKKTSLMEKLAWVAGIISGMYVVYLILHNAHVIKF
jgi:hypothetical protein